MANTSKAVKSIILDGYIKQAEDELQTASDIIRGRQPSYISGVYVPTQKTVDQNTSQILSIYSMGSQTKNPQYDYFIDSRIAEILKMDDVSTVFRNRDLYWKMKHAEIRFHSIQYREK